jgi:hypothetical protein
MVINISLNTFRITSKYQDIYKKESEKIFRNIEFLKYDMPFKLSSVKLL